MLLNIIVQLIGFVGIALNIIAVQFNKHWQIIFMKTLGSAAFVVQYILLEAYTGAAMDAIGIIRNIVFIFTVKKNKSTLSWIIVFSIITLVIGGLTWEGVISILAITAKLLTTIAYGINNAHKIRMLNLPSSACWITYNGIHFSLAGVLNEIFVTTSIIIAEIRYYKQNKEQNKKIKEEG